MGRLRPALNSRCLTSISVTNCNTARLRDPLLAGSFCVLKPLYSVIQFVSKPRLKNCVEIHNEGDDMAQRDNFWWRLTGWLAHLRRRFFGWITVPRAVALLLGWLGLMIGSGGYLYRYCVCQDWPNLVAGREQLFLDFYANVATTLVGITIVVLTIDLLNERRAEQQLKAQLIREMGSTDNGIALRAVRELRAHRWHKDGSLHEAKLWAANLQGAYLGGANLQGAYLGGANLQGASLWSAKLHGACLIDANLHRVDILTDTQLATAEGLRGATMPNGSRYDGRFNLNLSRRSAGGSRSCGAVSRHSCSFTGATGSWRCQSTTATGKTLGGTFVSEVGSDASASMWLFRRACFAGGDI